MLPVALTDTWPRCIVGPLIGLFIPLLQLLGDKQFGISGNYLSNPAIRSAAFRV